MSEATNVRKIWLTAVFALGLFGVVNQSGAANNLESATAPCRVSGLAQEVLCGVVRRPLDPAKPQGVNIDIHYVVLPALARRKLPDPVFLFAGGPGQSAISLVANMRGIFSQLNNRRDIVFVDQRGTGKSAPLLCDNVNDSHAEEVGDTDLFLARLKTCRAALEKLPYGDLRFFSTSIAVQDIDAVRVAIGANQINPVGASYGTRAVLEYQRQFPTRVRRAVLDGVAPPDMALPLSFSSDNQAAFDATLAACATQPACKERYPQLRQEWLTLLASMPKKIAVVDPVSGAIRNVTITRDQLLGAVRGPLYSPIVTSALPAAVHAAAEGRFESLYGLSSIAGSGKSKASKKMTLSFGMHLSVICAEDVPLLHAAAAKSANPPSADFADQQERLYEQACADWPRASIPPAFYTIPVSQTPVLLLSGGDDPATPPRHAERVLKALGEKATHIAVPHAAHGVIAIGCGPSLITRFINDTDLTHSLERDAKCLADIPRPTAFLPVAQTSESKQ